MGKYSTSPETMTDLGVVAAGGAGASSLNLAGHTSPNRIVAPTGPTHQLPSTEAATPTAGGGCIKFTGGAHSHITDIRMRSQGYRFVKADDGSYYYCPEGVDPPSTAVTPDTTDGTTDGTTEPGTGLGEFSWPQELTDLYKLLIARGTDMLGSPGYSDKSLSYAFGTDFEKMRQQEAATREQLKATQSSQGLLGTGTAAQQMSDLAWGTEGNISDLMRDIFVQNESQKRSDISLGQSLFGTGTDFAQALESINSARRGEGTMALQQLLTLLGILKG